MDDDPRQRGQRRRAPGNKLSARAALSAHGRVVAFDSEATDLVPGDTGGAFDVFVGDRAEGTTTWVSVDSTGAQGAGGSD